MMFCPQCGSSNAADARFCSACGTALAKEPPSSSNPVGESVPQAKPQRSAAKTVVLGCLGLLAAIVVIVIILAIIGGNNSGSNNTSNSGSTTSATTSSTEMPTTAPPTPTPTATPLPIAACCSVNVDGMHYTVTGVQRTGMITGDFNNTYNAQGEFIIVKLTEANETNQPANVSEDDFDLITAAGTKFAPNTEVTGLSDPLDGTINPGNSVSGTLVYDVPAGNVSTKFGVQCFANGATGDMTDWEAIRLPQSEYVGVGVLSQ